MLPNMVKALFKCYYEFKKQTKGTQFSPEVYIAMVELELALAKVESLLEAESKTGDFK